MFAQERKNLILSHLETQQRVTVTELAGLLSSSESTIRRDLQELEEQGMLQRTHGGAVLTDTASHEPTWQERDVTNADAKVKIGELASKLVREGDTVLLDSGTTTVHIARRLRGRNVTVVTNSVAIASELSTSELVHLVMLGGDLRPTTGALVGPFTEQMLHQLHVDILFLGANGLHSGGVTTPNAVEAATKRAMVRAANSVVVAADLSKIGQINFVDVCSWQDVDMLVMDGAIDDEMFNQALAEHNVSVRYPS